jgi:hypothetical protein
MGLYITLTSRHADLLNDGFTKHQQIYRESKHTTPGSTTCLKNCKSSVFSFLIKREISLFLFLLGWALPICQTK